jgi:hypothetical protein
MTVSNATYLKGFYDDTKALGANIVKSDAMMEIEGFESTTFLIKAFPFPILTPQDPIEISMPLGMMAKQPSQIKIAQEGPITIKETVAFTANKLLIDLIVRSSLASFNAKIYEGTPEKYLRALRIRDAFIVGDIPDRDWESRTEAFMIQGTLHYHFFGEYLEGNSTDYR